MLFSIFFILIHNILFTSGMIINTTKYTLNDMLAVGINSIFFSCGETMPGALWFVPVYIFASVIFAAMIYYSRKIKDKIKSENKELTQNIIIIILTLLIGGFGYYINYKDVYLMYHVQTSFVVIPFLFAKFLTLSIKLFAFFII